MKTKMEIEKKSPPVTHPEAEAAREYLAMNIRTLEDELKDEHEVAACWGIEQTIAGLKAARALVLAARGKAS